MVLLNLTNLISPVCSGPHALDLDSTLSGVASGLREVVQAVLARHVGFTGLGDTAAIQEVVRAEPFESVQTYFNILNPSAGFVGHTGGQQDFHGLIDTAARAGRAVIVIRVLAAGAAAAVPERSPNAGDPGGNLVSGGTYTSDLERAQGAARLARDLGLDSPVELAIRFGLSKPGVSTVLVGYSTVGQLEEAIKYAERGALSADALQRVLELSSPH